MNTNTYLYILLLSILLIGCSKDEENRYPNVEEPLHIYFDRFIEEAQERGLNLDLSDIDGRISPVSSPGLIGLCQFRDDQNNTITVDNNAWEESDTLFREYVVFHELGHCKLLREHLDLTDAEGACFSMMASGTASCMINYTPETREELIDELFSN